MAESSGHLKAQGAQKIDPLCAFCAFLWLHDLLKLFDTMLAKQGHYVRYWCEFHLCAILWDDVLMRCMLELFGGGVLELVQDVLDVAWHGNVFCAL